MESVLTLRRKYRRNVFTTWGRKCLFKTQKAQTLKENTGKILHIIKIIFMTKKHSKQSETSSDKLEGYTCIGRPSKRMLGNINKKNNKEKNGQKKLDLSGRYINWYNHLKILTLPSEVGGCIPSDPKITFKGKKIEKVAHVHKKHEIGS